MLPRGRRSENTFRGTPHPALESLDTADRMIYVGSLSKTFAPLVRAFGCARTRSPGK